MTIRGITNLRFRAGDCDTSQERSLRYVEHNGGDEFGLRTEYGKVDEEFCSRNTDFGGAEGAFTGCHREDGGESSETVKGHLAVR